MLTKFQYFISKLTLVEDIRHCSHFENNHVPSSIFKSLASFLYSLTETFKHTDRVIHVYAPPKTVSGGIKYLKLIPYTYIHIWSIYTVSNQKEKHRLLSIWKKCSYKQKNFFSTSNLSCIIFLIAFVQRALT